MAVKGLDAAFDAIIKDCQAVAVEAVKNAAKKAQADIVKEADNYLNVSLALVILCDSDDARKIIEKTVTALANNYEIMLSTSFHEQRAVTESVLSLGMLDSKIMRNVSVEVVEGLVGGDMDADAKIEI